MARDLWQRVLQTNPAIHQGYRLVAIANRTAAHAEDAYRVGGVKETVRVKEVNELTATIQNSTHAITDDASLLFNHPDIDVIVEVTGNIDYGASIVMDTIKAGKHIVTMSAELDATIGPILKHTADKAGVVYTVADGDQPGVTQNLMSFKGLGSPFYAAISRDCRMPKSTTQEGCQKWGKILVVTSLTDQNFV